jgi:hypothetical protein
VNRWCLLRIIYLEEICGHDFLSNGVSPPANTIHWRSTKVLRELYWQKYYQFGLKGAQMIQNEKRLGPPSFYNKKQTEKTTAGRIGYLYRKGNGYQEGGQ